MIHLEYRWGGKMSEYLLLPASLRLLVFAVLMFSATITIIGTFYYVLARERTIKITYFGFAFLALFVMLNTRTPLYGDQDVTIAEFFNIIVFIPLIMSLNLLFIDKKIIYLFDFIFFVLNIIYLSYIPNFNYIMAFSALYALIRGLLILFDIIDKNKEKRGILCIKDALDNLDNGIILFSRFGRTKYINKSMIDELKEIGIESYSPNEIIEYLESNAHKIDNLTYVVKTNNKYYKYSLNNPLTQISTFDVTELVELINKEQQINFDLNNKNKELNDNLYMINLIQEEKDILELKTQIHDNLAQELSILHMSLLTNNIKNLKELKKNLASIKIASVENTTSITELIETYKDVDVNIELVGTLPTDEKIYKLFYDAIRESTTNAIKHCFAKNIYVNSYKENNQYILTIKNYGNIPKTIKFGNGLNGLKFKVNELNGSLNVDTTDGFMVKITI